MKIQRMSDLYGLRETTVCLNRLFNIAISLERDKEYSIEEISARASLDQQIIRKGIEGCEYLGIFKKNAFNNKYFVPSSVKI